MLKHKDSAACCEREEALGKDAFVPDKSRRTSKWVSQLLLALAQTRPVNRPCWSSNSMKRRAGGLLGPKRVARRRGRGRTDAMTRVGDWIHTGASTQKPALQPQSSALPEGRLEDRGRERHRRGSSEISQTACRLRVNDFEVPRSSRSLSMTS
jgi:hypothetical protein